MSDPLRVEASGETVADARAAALRELGRLTAGRLDESAVSYVVISEGRRGLLGVGAEQARVLASYELSAREEAQADGGTAAHARLLVERVSSALGVRCTVELEETDETVSVTCRGDDLGRLIGYHGQTLDALQVVAGAALQRLGDPREVCVDAADYRARRASRIEERARDAAAEALRRGERVALEPMSAAERKLVHTLLAEEPGIVTSSEGTEPRRCVVIEPA